MKSRPTKVEILRHLSYNRRHGEFRWVLPTSSRVAKGDPAGSVSADGYVLIGLFGLKLFRSHIVWFLEKGCWPSLRMDHRNTDRLDDRVNNLRDVPQKWNSQNLREAQKNSRSGLLGAYWDPVRNVWFSSIKVEGRTKALGRYQTALAAHKAYVKAKRKHHEGNTL